jgi:hypothetical protein
MWLPVMATWRPVGDPEAGGSPNRTVPSAGLTSISTSTFIG